jgi:hypothetical protein
MVMVKKEGHKILTFLDHGLHGLHGLLRTGLAVTPGDDEFFWPSRRSRRY